MARNKRTDDNPPVETDEPNTGTNEEEGDGDEGDDAAAQLATHDGHLTDLESRLQHVEDVLHSILLASGMYAQAGPDRLKLAETIKARDAA